MFSILGTSQFWIAHRFLFMSGFENICFNRDDHETNTSSEHLVEIQAFERGTLNCTIQYSSTFREGQAGNASEAKYLNVNSDDRWH